MTHSLSTNLADISTTFLWAAKTQPAWTLTCENLTHSKMALSGGVAPTDCLRSDHLVNHDRGIRDILEGGSMNILELVMCPVVRLWIM